MRTIEATVSGKIAGALVDDGVYGYGCLSGLAVADYELALPAADRNHRIYCLDAGLEWFVHGFAEDYSRGLALKRHQDAFSADFAKPVERRADRVHNPADKSFARRNGGDYTQAAHLHVFADQVRLAHKHDADIVFLEVHDDALDAGLELNELAHLGVRQTVYSCYTVTYAQYGTYLLIFWGDVDSFEFFEQYIGNFTCPDAVLRHMNDWIKLFCWS